MKTLSQLLSILLFAGSTCIAQPTITMEDVTPEIGTSVTRMQFQFSEPGSSGENQLWDFSVIPSSFPINLAFVAPETAPSSENFPDATHVIATGSVFSEFRNYANDSISILGFYSPGGGPNPVSLTIYSDPMNYPIFPLNYNNTFSDTYVNQTTNEISTGPDTGTMIFNTTGSYVAHVDGYGTVLTPNGSFEDVLRVHNLSDYEYTSTLNGEFHNAAEVSISRYHFYKAGIPLPLVSISTTIRNFYDGSADTSISCSYLNVIPVSIAEHQNFQTRISIFPNPATTHLNLEIEAETETEFGFTLLTIDGKTAHVWPVRAIHNGKNLIQLSLPELPSGMYFIQLQGENSLETRRVILE